MSTYKLFLLIAICIAALLSMVSAQGLDYLGGYFSQALQRDQRANRGPVLFPTNPPGTETSGVRVGASGYGFVPPGGATGPIVGVLPGAGPNIGHGINYW
ncbi:uncharacterized protein LOC111043519 isoform X2 [Nilaparvata lugens]|uniref:uncharacterized protein LOC111043519 isoform X2 n=1 Tax=Nilaparvata lugens TaxID=108931 RepID=UPI000B98AD8D|nr:uncharacterized protein LOC111043519 isoform X2 [Nilaparvata lugens]